MFGIIDRKRSCRIAIVNYRTTETIQKLIFKYVKPGTTIHSDGWRAYNGIEWEKYNYHWIRNVH